MAQGYCAPRRGGEQRQRSRATPQDPIVCSGRVVPAEAAAPRACSHGQHTWRWPKAGPLAAGSSTLRLKSGGQAGPERTRPGSRCRLGCSWRTRPEPRQGPQQKRPASEACMPRPTQGSGCWPASWLQGKAAPKRWPTRAQSRRSGSCPRSRPGAEQAPWPAACRARARSAARALSRAAIALMSS